MLIRWRISVSSQQQPALSNLLLFLLPLLEFSEVHSRGGRRGGGRSRSSPYGSSGTSNYGANSHGASSSGTGGSGYSSSGGFASKPSNHFTGGPTGTLNRLYSSPSMVRVNPARPQARVPVAVRTQPTKVVYSSYYVDNYASGGRGALSRPAVFFPALTGYSGRYVHGHRHGAPSLLFYVPHRQRYADYYEPISVASTDFGHALPNRHLDLCKLARWNRELPFAELPNMAIDFLGNDNISGVTLNEKSRFVLEFFTTAVDAFATYNRSADIFAIPLGKTVSRCMFPLSDEFDLRKSTDGIEEPFITAVRHVVGSYSHIGKEAGKGALQDVVDAAKVCLPEQRTNYKEPMSNTEVLGCLDYTLNPRQLLDLQKPRSIFGNAEICQRHLDADLFKCLPGNTTACKLEHLVALNLFARNFYLCSEEFERHTMTRLQARIVELYGDSADNSANILATGGLQRIFVVGLFFSLSVWTKVYTSE